MKLSELTNFLKESDIELKVRVTYKTPNDALVTLTSHFPTLEVENVDFALTPQGEKNVLTIYAKGDKLSIHKKVDL